MSFGQPSGGERPDRDALHPYQEIPSVEPLLPRDWNQHHLSDGLGSGMAIENEVR